LITGAVDNELSPEEKLLLSEHMKTCEQCRADYQTELWFKGFVREKLGGHTAPSDLVQAVQTGLDAGSGTGGGLAWVDRLKDVLAVPLVRPAIALGIVVALSLLFLRGGKQRDVIEQSLAHYEEAVAGTFQLQLASGEPALLREYFADKTDFPVMIPKMVDCRILGAILEEHPDGAVAELLYEHEYAKIYLYQTSWADVESGRGALLSPDVKEALVRTNIYSRTDPNGRTIVLWKKGPTLASAVSDMSKSDLIMCLTSGDPGLLAE
jgi:hypothetical protein